MPSCNEHQAPLIAHVIQRLAVGGLENGLVNLINCMPPEQYRHAIICLTDSTEYASRIRQRVEIIELRKRPGQDLGVHGRYYKILRALAPDIVHTRNLPALEFQAVAALAGVAGRIHGEHGRDIYDLDGQNFKYNVLRKTIRPFIHRYIAVSQDLAKWLNTTVKVPKERLTQIYNGVDTETFYPRRSVRISLGPQGFISSDSFVVGTVGRMEPIKDQPTLVRAFIHLLKEHGEWRKRLRLVVVGNGILRQQALRLLHDADVDEVAWLPGERSDIPDLMRSLDLFVLPSLREGISNTILEAMASGLPVVATAVGGNPELVDNDTTGMLVPHSDVSAMANSIATYIANPNKAAAHGRTGRAKVDACFSMKSMVDSYCGVYDTVLGHRTRNMEASSCHPHLNPLPSRERK